MFMGSGFFEPTKGGTPPPPPLPPNATEFVSAATTNDHTVEVTLSDNTITAGVDAEWKIKINGTAHRANASAFVPGHPDTSMFLVLDSGTTFAKGDTITVSHLVAASGIKKFIDKPVTNKIT